VALRILVIRSDWETATHWGAEWFKRNVVEPAKQNGFDVIDLHAEKATKTEVMRAIREKNPRYVAGIGHGNKHLFTGQNGKTIFIIDDKDTCEASENRIIHLLSCITAVELGPYMVDCGADAYLGYNDVFGFKIDENDFPNKYATPFFDSDTAIDRAFFAGKTAKQAYQDAIDRFNYWLEHAPEVCKPLLLHDRNALTLLGDENAKITVSTKIEGEIGAIGEVKVKIPLWRKILNAIITILKKIWEWLREILESYSM